MEGAKDPESEKETLWAEKGVRGEEVAGAAALALKLEEGSQSKGCRQLQTLEEATG